MSAKISKAELAAVEMLKADLARLMEQSRADLRRLSVAPSQSIPVSVGPSTSPQEASATPVRGSAQDRTCSCQKPQGPGARPTSPTRQTLFDAGNSLAMGEASTGRLIRKSLSRFGQWWSRLLRALAKAWPRRHHTPANGSPANAGTAHGLPEPTQKRSGGHPSDTPITQPESGQ